MPGKFCESYLTPYREAWRRHGDGFAVTLWANPASQRRRFEVLADLVDCTGKRVLDAGCSRGDFAAFLLQREQPYASYIGVDGLSDLIDRANQRGLRGASFYCRDFVTHPRTLSLGEPQVIAISGSLNTMRKRTALAVLDAAWQAAGETLAFNFLSDRTGPDAVPQQQVVHRLPTLDLLDWALARTWAVQFRQDYFDQGHDGTIVMHKGL
jgi:SAM-dependent methyltransferase